MNLFLDTNIWLSLYSMSSDDLEQFEKLKRMLNAELRLFIPQQVKDEVFRNRDNKIKEALSSFKDLTISCPNIVRETDEYEEFRKTFDNLVIKQKEIRKKVENSVEKRNTKADKIINYFMRKNNLIEVTEEMVKSGVLRYEKGNPPGKDNKYGDAINWECLLSEVPDGEQLYFVSADKDYKSVLDDSRFNLYLELEWKEKKQSKIMFYNSLTNFFKDNFEEINLETENIKNELIDGLCDSRHFTMTHQYISQLEKYDDWSDDQIERICEGAEQNSQIHYIYEDRDVKRFLTNITASYKKNDLNVVAVKNAMAKGDI